MAFNPRDPASRKAERNPSDLLLVIDGLTGESQDSKHPGAIEIADFSWGNQNNGSASTGGGAGAGKVLFKDIRFRCVVNIASPKLALACATGKHFEKAQLFVRKQGLHQQNYYVVTLEDFIVSSYCSDCSDEDLIPLDTFTLNFARVNFDYRRQKGDGTLDPPVTMGWDIKANRQR